MVDSLLRYVGPLELFDHDRKPTNRSGREHPPAQGRNAIKVRRL